MENKRGQAAMEFLMTYGWAILAAVIAIGVLWYMGVFSPDTNDVAILNPPFGGEVEQMVTAGSIRIIANSGAGDTINVTSFVIEGCGTNNTNMQFADGAKVDINVTCSPVLTADKFRGKIEITYLKAGNTIPQVTTGSINAKVQ
jgi:uncharacterized protein (UPF0333 family)